MGANPHSLGIPKRTPFDAVILSDHAAGLSHDEMARKYETTVEGLMGHLRRLGILPPIEGPKPVEEEKVVPIRATPPVARVFAPVAAPKVKAPVTEAVAAPRRTRDQYFENAKLTPSDDVIRADRLSGMSTYAMAAKYGVSQSIIHRHLMRLGMVGTKPQPEGKVVAIAEPVPPLPCVDSGPDIEQLLVIARLMRDADVDAETAVSIIIAARAL